jgi:hypothetical protein
MGYTTDFDGSFELDRSLASEHREYLVQFNETRRMRRDPSRLKIDPIRDAAKLPHGPEGAYYVGGGGMMGQDREDSVVEYNSPPYGQPGLWCGWRPNEEGTAIIWDGGEKFYSYVEWLQYLVDHFLGPWDYKLNGKINWYGEDHSDTGTITVKDNVISTSSIEEEKQVNEDRIKVLENTLQLILDFQKNPIRRNQYSGNPDYKAPDWIQTKDRIFEIAKAALKK